jgi:hypothetical protein
MPDEFAIGLATGALGGTLDPWPMPVTPMSDRRHASFEKKPSKIAEKGQQSVARL